MQIFHTLGGELGVNQHMENSIWFLHLLFESFPQYIFCLYYYHCKLNCFHKYDIFQQKSIIVSREATLELALSVIRLFVC